MSLRINSCMPFIINYNNEDVQTVYYNNNLVWDKNNLDWSSGVSWADLYALCKQRQAGTIASFPDVVQLGMLMDMPIKSGVQNVKVKLIDIESEGPGILIFQQYQAYNIAMGLGYSGLMGARYVMDEYFPQVYDYIKPLNKPTYTADVYGELIEKNELSYVWELSRLEIDETANSYDINVSNGSTFTINNDYTVGKTVKYPYLYTKANRMRLGLDGTFVEYGLRSYSYIQKTTSSTKESTGTKYYISNKGEIISERTTTGNPYQFGCFAIG